MGSKNIFTFKAIRV